MKLNIKFAILTLIFPIYGYAKEYSNENQLIKETPAPINGIEIVTPSKMVLTNQAIKINQHNTSASQVKMLLSMKKSVPTEISQYKNNKNPLDTHLKHQLSSIKLAFPYKSFTSKLNNLGYAPIGTTVDGKWTGIKEFFTDKQLGACSLSVYNIKLSHMGIRLNAKEVSYLVNNHPTTQSIQGNDKDGYLYMLSWFTPSYAKDLECADSKFYSDRIKQMIAFASRREEGA